MLRHHGDNDSVKVKIIPSGGQTKFSLNSVLELEIFELYLVIRLRHYSGIEVQVFWRAQYIAIAIEPSGFIELSSLISLQL